MSDFQLTLIGDGITVERTVDRATALVILNSVLGSGASVDFGGREGNNMLNSTATTALIEAPETPDEHDSRYKEKPVSLREFVNEHEPKTNAQIILCMGHFLATYENIERFGRESIRPKFPAAGEPLPKNFSRDFQTAIDKGWIGEDPQNRGQYYVTRTGEAQLDMGFRGRRN